MHPLDRYLRRVAFWLPPRHRPDILEELRSVLEDRLEGEAAARDRDLTEPEIERVLQDFGAPAIIVARFVKRRPVISSGLAYFFWRVLTLALVAILFAQLLAFVNEARGGLSSEIALQALERTFVAMLLGFACVTVSFVLLDRRYGAQEYG